MNENNPNISIIVPVYNTEEYIGKCIESVLSQTYENFELILIDDGSRDSSGVICDKFELLDNRIRVIHKSNKGVSAARNVGIDNSLGRYIAFIDGDDFLFPKYLENLINFMENNNCEVVQSGYCKITNSNKRNVPCIEDNLVTTNPEIILRKLRGLVWAKLFKADIIKQNNIRFNEGISLAEDLCFVLNYSYYIEKMGFLTTCEYMYNNRPTSASHSSHNPNSLILEIKEELLHINNLQKKWPKSKAFEYRFQLIGNSVLNFLLELISNDGMEGFNRFIYDTNNKKYLVLLHYARSSSMYKQVFGYLGKREKWSLFLNLGLFLTTIKKIWRR